MTRVTFKTKPLTKKLESYKQKALKVIASELEELVPGQILKGISPVKNKGRYQRYSESYRNQIKNKAAFFKRNGKLIVVSSTSRSAKRFIKSFNAKRIPSDKKVSPVNLKLSGDLHRSFFVKLTRNTVKVGFDNELADIHNRKGAGRSKVIRRMLPTNKGEVFNRTITLRLRESLINLKRNAFK